MNMSEKLTGIVREKAFKVTTETGSEFTLTLKAKFDHVCTNDLCDRVLSPIIINNQVPLRKKTDAEIKALNGKIEVDIMPIGVRASVTPLTPEQVRVKVIEQAPTMSAVELAKLISDLQEQAKAKK